MAHDDPPAHLSVTLRPPRRSLPRCIRTERLDHEQGAHALYRSLGMTPVRYHEELLRPLDDPPMDPVPSGIRIVPWDIERNDDLRVVKNEAFTDHWGSTPTTGATRLFTSLGSRTQHSVTTSQLEV